jgi:F-type H+-transporting ATPase subunit c
MLGETMMKKLSYLFMALSFMSFAVPMFAQGGEGAGGVNWVAMTAGFSMAIASAVCGMAQAKATAAAAEGLARNPAARPGIQLALILGLALIESLALYTLVIIFAKVK